MTLDEMADSKPNWPVLQDLIMTGQVEEQRLVQLVEDHPDFCQWFIEVRAPAWAR